MNNTQKKLRTLRQNSAIHLFCRKVSKALNDAGLDIRATLKPDFDIEWSPESFKELVWKQSQKIALGKESTTELETNEVQKIYDIINRFLAKHGLHVPFPSKEELMIAHMSTD